MSRESSEQTSAPQTLRDLLQEALDWIVAPSSLTERTTPTSIALNGFLVRARAALAAAPQEGPRHELPITEAEVELVRDAGRSWVESYEYPNKTPSQQPSEWHEGKVLLHLADRLDDWRRMGVRAHLPSGGPAAPREPERPRPLVAAADILAVREFIRSSGGLPDEDVHEAAAIFLTRRLSGAPHEPSPDGPSAPDLSKVTRFEVIDHREGAQPFGRVFSAWDASGEMSLQDNGRTLKLFLSGVASRRPDGPSEARSDFPWRAQPYTAARKHDPRDGMWEVVWVAQKAGVFEAYGRFYTEAEARAVRDALNRVASRGATGEP